MKTSVGMGLFDAAPNPFDDIIEKVTAENLTTENWAMILDVCDKINVNPTQNSKSALLAIRKRLNDRDPHIVMYALSVLDSCWCNCGSTFRREVSSAAFINQLQANCTSGTRLIAEKARLMVKKWAESECASDPSLSLVSSLYSRLKEDGFSFESSEPKKTAPVSSDPFAVTSQEEEDALAKAIALSLEEEDKKKGVKTGKLYPSNAATNGHTSTTAKVNKPERKVRALYDFEAAEDNELSFVAGDVITLTEDSDPNWWQGRIGSHQGLFPANFVTFDLEPSVEVVEPKPTVQQSQPVQQVDESLLLRCIHMIEALDPTGELPDPPELSQIEAAANAQAPLIDARLAAIDRQHNALASIDVAIRDVLNMYDHAVQAAQYQPPASYGLQQSQAHGQGQSTTASAYGQQPQSTAGPAPYAMQQPPHSLYQQQVVMSSAVNPMLQQQPMLVASDNAGYGQQNILPTSAYPGYHPQSQAGPLLPASSAYAPVPSLQQQQQQQQQPYPTTYPVSQTSAHPYQ